MSDQHPNVEDEVERALRLGLATASQIADRYARARQDFARDAQHRLEQEARQLEARYRAEGASAAALLAVVDRTEWWDRAAPADITSSWQLAVQWQDEQPRAAIAVETIAREVHDRYGLDVHAPGVDAEVIHAAVNRLDEEQQRPAGLLREDDTASAVGAVLRANQRDDALARPADESQREWALTEERNVELGAMRATEAPEYRSEASDDGTAKVADEEPRASSAHNDDQASLTHPDGSAAKVDGGPRSRLVYDSAERRAHDAAHFRDAGLSTDSIAVAMRADVAHASPASASAVSRASTRSVSTRGASRRAELEGHLR